MPPSITDDRNRFAQQLFTPLPARYDQLAEVLSMGQNGRWRRAMVDRIVAGSPGTLLDVASGTAGVALQVVERTSADVVGVDLTMEMLARGLQNVAAAKQGARIHLVASRAEQLPFPDATFDALDFYLPPSLCRGSRGHIARAGESRQTGWFRRQPRISPAAESLLACDVVALHPDRPPRRRLHRRRARVVPRGPFPGTQHLWPLSKVSRVLDKGRVGNAQDSKMWGCAS